ncbi:MAG: hypothetical protein C0605_10710 [Hyphomicrobiales bacterium]|nr:MAG: hypothetical protein C0605_10710 [Hyphomicrobiales bacterium]
MSLRTRIKPGIQKTLYGFWIGFGLTAAGIYLMLGLIPGPVVEAFTLVGVLVFLAPIGAVIGAALSALRALSGGLSSPDHLSGHSGAPGRYRLWLAFISGLALSAAGFVLTASLFMWLMDRLPYIPFMDQISMILLVLVICAAAVFGALYGTAIVLFRPPERSGA